jgi:hypothetical protein
MGIHYCEIMVIIIIDDSRDYIDIYIYTWGWGQAWGGRVSEMNGLDGRV